MGTEAPTTAVTPVAYAPKKALCPSCGKPGRRKRTLTRMVRTVASKVVAFLEVTSGAYQARCNCCTTFRNTPEGVLPKARSDNKARDLVLDRILQARHEHRADLGVAPPRVLPRPLLGVRLRRTP